MGDGNQILILNFDGFVTAVEALTDTYAADGGAAYILADDPEDPTIANHSSQGVVRHSDFLYPTDILADPNTAARELSERADTSLWGSLFTTAGRIAEDPPEGRVFTTDEFTEYVTELSTEHRDSLIISGTFNPSGNVQFLAPGDGEGMAPDAYTAGETKIPSAVFADDDLKNLMKLTEILHGSLIVPRDMVTERAEEIADGELDVTVKGEGGDR